MQDLQLDIFDHSRDVMLRNDVVGALQQRDASSARSAWRTLRDEFPRDDMLLPCGVLIGALEPPTSGPPFVGYDAVRDARRLLAIEIEPSAQRVFGEQGGVNWVAPLWRDMAERASRLPYRSDRSEEHAAPLWLRACDWQRAAEAVARIESWRRIPAPLGWMAEASFRLEGLDATWPLLAELAWLAPARCRDLASRLGDASFEKLQAQFDASFEGEGDATDFAWFPAWVLTEKPGLAGLVGSARPSLDSAPERAMRLMVELLRLERQGRHHEVIERRKHLRDTHSSLYAAYIRRR